VTVVLAVRCEDGLVLASDSQITEKGRGMSYPAQKLHDLGPDAAWGGSGARSVLLDLEVIFRREADEIVGSRDVARAVQERVLPVLRHHYDTFIAEVPGEGTAGTPSAYVLAAGYSHGEPFIVEINPNGMINRYEEIGFHAIGSGAPMAQQAGALLAHFQMAERDVAYGVVVVVRVLDALAQTSPSVGGPIDVCRLTEDGAHHLDDDEIAEVRDNVARWEELEKEALDQLF
jgi:proteasome beta subunit